MTIYKVKSAILRAKGERIEGVDRDRMEARLAEVQKSLDPAAKLLALPERGR